LLGEDLAAMIIMLLVVMSLAVSWISLRKKESGAIPEQAYTQPHASWLEEPRAMPASPRVNQRDAAPRSRHAAGGASASTVEKQSATNTQRPRREAGTSGHGESEPAQRKEGVERPRGEEKPGGKGEETTTTPEAESESIPDVERLESQLLETKKLFAVLLEEYERLKQLID